MDSPLFTIKETSEYLNVGKATVYSMIRANDFPGIRVGGTWRVIKSELDTWIKHQYTHKNL